MPETPIVKRTAQDYDVIFSRLSEASAAQIVIQVKNLEEQSKTIRLISQAISEMDTPHITTFVTA
jgi:hypothetical protein